MQEITTQDVLSVLSDSTVQIIDVRPIEYYNGWKKFNEKRGGHIKNARSLPIKWLNYIDWVDIVQGKDIKQDQTLVIYSYSTQDSMKVAERFQKSGYSKVQVYTKFLEEWNPDESLPMDKLAR
jgi:thiosulfate/3-mercaptopyruvate sulfurtransferase